MPPCFKDLLYHNRPPYGPSRGPILGPWRGPFWGQIPLYAPMFIAFTVHGEAQYGVSQELALAGQLQGGPLAGPLIWG